MVTGAMLTLASSGSFARAGTLTLANNWTNLTLSGSQSPTIETKSLGAAGWLSSGAYDPASRRFVPPAMSHRDRLAAGRVVLQLPVGWNLGSITTARDEIVWYQVWRDGATPPPL